MEVLHWMVDRKIRALNASGVTTIGEYADLSEAIIETNELQRRRVRTSGKPYELLRKDLLDGCVMPPLILAVADTYSGDIRPKVESILEDESKLHMNRKSLDGFLAKAVKDKELIILDGLQRTYTIKECIVDAAKQDRLDELLARPLRLEVYIGLGKLGLLYRMLTLNTGQTPMSFRHQIEIMYHDYLESATLPDGIVVTREADDSKARGIGRYRYSDVVDMFYAFTIGIPASISRGVLVQQLKELTFLEEYKPDQEDMLPLMSCYNALVKSVCDSSGKWHAATTEEEYAEGRPIIERPFAVDVPSIFSKVQAMTGFGAEVHRLLRSGTYSSLTAIMSKISQLEYKGTGPTESLDNLLQILDQIASKAKKIGDAQRAYFQLAFRYLLTPNLFESYLDLSSCWITAQQHYEAQY